MKRKRIWESENCAFEFQLSHSLSYAFNFVNLQHGSICILFLWPQRLLGDEQMAPAIVIVAVIVIAFDLASITR